MAQLTSSSLATQLGETTNGGSDRQHFEEIEEIVARELERLKNPGSESTERNLTTVQEMTQTSVIGGEQTERNYAGIFDLRPVTLPARSKPRTTLHPLQEWEGYVVEIGSTEFVAHLIDMTSGNSSYAKEEAVIPKEEISKLDAEKMQVGNIFRWVIGYECSIAGPKKRVSLIVFRDLPNATETDLKQSDEWAIDTAHSLTS